MELNEELFLWHDPVFDREAVPKSYVDLNGGNRVFIPATGWTVQAGAPVQSIENVFTGWAMDAAANEAVQGVGMVPNGWTTFDVDIWWTPVNTNAGNVVWEGNYSIAGDSEATSSDGTATSLVSAAPEVRALKVAANWFSGVAAQDDSLIGFRVRRQGAHASDTYASDAVFVGLMLRKAS